MRSRLVGTISISFGEDHSGSRSRRMQEREVRKGGAQSKPALAPNEEEERSGERLDGVISGETMLEGIQNWIPEVEVEGRVVQVEAAGQKVLPSRALSEEEEYLRRTLLTPIGSSEGELSLSSVESTRRELRERESEQRGKLQALEQQVREAEVLVKVEEQEAKKQVEVAEQEAKKQVELAEQEAKFRVEKAEIEARYHIEKVKAESQQRLIGAEQYRLTLREKQEQGVRELEVLKEVQASLLRKLETLNL